jgi:hypothetical protein
MNIYEIDAAITACVDQETGEILDEAALDALVMERDKKIENVACWIKDLKAESNAIREEEKVLAERRHSSESKVESLKKWLAYALNGEKFKTAKVSVSYWKSKSVQVTDEKAIDEKFFIPQPAKLNKKMVSKYLKDGMPVRGCELAEKTSLQVR